MLTAGQEERARQEKGERQVAQGKGGKMFTKHWSLQRMRTRGRKVARLPVSSPCIHQRDKEMLLDKARILG